jgi:hypothetical protein
VTQQNNPGMVIMGKCLDSPNIRKGRFLWMEKSERDSFLCELNARIAQGYYYSDFVFSKIAEDLSQVMAETVDST